MKFDRLVNLLLTESESKVLKLKRGEFAPKNYTGVAEWPNGTKYWYLNDQRHREDGPAVEYSGGSKFWYLNGQRHREDGPAYEHTNGIKYWFLNDREVTEEEFNQRRKLKELGGADFDGILDI